MAPMLRSRSCLTDTPWEERGTLVLHTGGAHEPVCTHALYQMVEMAMLNAPGPFEQLSIELADGSVLDPLDINLLYNSPTRPLVYG